MSTDTKKLNPLVPLGYLVISGALLITVHAAYNATTQAIEDYKNNLIQSKLVELYSKNYKHGSAIKPLKQFTETELRESIIYYQAMSDQCTDAMQKADNAITDFNTQNKLSDK